MLQKQINVSAGKEERKRERSVSARGEGKKEEEERNELVRTLSLSSAPLRPSDQSQGGEPECRSGKGKSTLARPLCQLGQRESKEGGKIEGLLHRQS